MKNANRPAYPVEVNGNGEGLQTSDHSGMATGLTKREYFAAIAMQGIIAGFTNEDMCNGHFIPDTEYPLLMLQAVQIADELLKQLELKQ